MRLSWRRASDIEGRLDSWIRQSHQRRVLAGENTPVGPCPDEAFLRDLARRSKRISLSDARVDHAATCPQCMGRLLELRQEAHSSSNRLVFAVAIASCLSVTLVVLAIARYRVVRPTSPGNLAVISQTVNLWDVGTYRGQQTGQSQSVSMPTGYVAVKIILPRFSAPGNYVVSVTRDQNGNGLVAQGNAIAVSREDKETLSVDLDLRKAKAGQYFLATTHEQDQSAYYYPLQIK
jgi:hypothetical protein